MDSLASVAWRGHLLVTSESFRFDLCSTNEKKKEIVISKIPMSVIPTTSYRVRKVQVGHRSVFNCYQMSLFLGDCF